MEEQGLDKFDHADEHRHGRGDGPGVCQVAQGLCAELARHDAARDASGGRRRCEESCAAHVKHLLDFLDVLLGKGMCSDIPLEDMSAMERMEGWAVLDDSYMRKLLDLTTDVHGARFQHVVMFVSALHKMLVRLAKVAMFWKTALDQNRLELQVAQQLDDHSDKLMRNVRIQLGQFQRY